MSYLYKKIKIYKKIYFFATFFLFINLPLYARKIKKKEVINKTSTVIPPKETLSHIPYKAKARNTFGEVRHLYSYDPKTKEWKTIEKFKGIKMLEYQDRDYESICLYKNFWAYDPLRNHWKKVDINAYGYKKTKPSVLSKLFSGYGIDLYIGGAYTFYNATISSNSYVIKKLEDYSLEGNEGNENVSYHLDFFTEDFVRKSNDDTSNTNEGEYLGAVPLDENTVFKGSSYSVPITFLIRTQLTQSLKAGLGTTGEIHFITGLKPDGDEEPEAKVKDGKYYTLAGELLLGYDFWQTENQKIGAELKGGASFNMTSKFSPIYWRYIGDIAINYQYRFTNTMSFALRPYIATKSPSITRKDEHYHPPIINMRELSIGLQLGLIFNF